MAHIRSLSEHLPNKVLDLIGIKERELVLGSRHDCRQHEPETHRRERPESVHALFLSQPDLDDCSSILSSIPHALYSTRTDDCHLQIKRYSDTDPGDVGILGEEICTVRRIVHVVRHHSVHSVRVWWISSDAAMLQRN